MNIIYCSEAEFHKLKPNKNTTVITLDSELKTLMDFSDTKWKRHVVYPFKVIDDRGGSFKEMDDQAKGIAEFLKTIDYTDTDIMFQCVYGEIRSVILAHTLAFIVPGNVKAKTIKDGKLIDAVFSGMSTTFAGRTLGHMHDILDEFFNVPQGT